MKSLTLLTSVNPNRRIPFSSFDIGLWGVKIRALSFHLGSLMYGRCGEVLIGVNFSKLNWLSVCLFSVSKGFEFEAACCMNCNKGGIFLSFPVSVWKVLCDIYNVSSRYFHRYVKDTLVTVTFSAWTVCTWEKWQENTLPVTEASE